MTPQERESAVLDFMEKRFSVKQWKGRKAWDAVAVWSTLLPATRIRVGCCRTLRQVAETGIR